MKLTASLSVACAASACASPLVARDDPPPSAPTSATAKTHLYVCADANFKGTCENLEVDTGKCYNLTDKWNKKISSGGPDEKTFCSAYPTLDCGGKAFPFTYPGIRNLTRYGYNDVISSYRCEFLGGFDVPN